MLFCLAWVGALARLWVMRLLLSAIACSPTLGSEAHFGWCALVANARIFDEVHLLGHVYNQTELEAARESGLLPPNVHLHFAGTIHLRGRSPMLARIHNWRAYASWSAEILPIAEHLHRKIGFSFSQHATVSSWRVPSPLWKIRGLKFIWGPLGGGEVFPLSLLGILSPKTAAYELARKLQGVLAICNPEVRACARNAEVLLASNEETAKVLLSLGARRERVKLLSPGFFLPGQIESLAKGFENAEGVKSGAESGVLRLFAGGEIEGRKGIGLALDAIALFRRENDASLTYTIAGGGAELPALHARAKALGLKDCVRFVPTLRGAHYVEALAAADIYLLPSLRDSVGLTLMEAMICECIPVVADCGGPGRIVTPDCGIKIRVCRRGQMIRDLADALSRLASMNPADRTDMGKSAAGRVVKNFSLASYEEALADVYRGGGGGLRFKV
jgi:glycosyltransferase involved in cell wall biosynthesis